MVHEGEDPQEIIGPVVDHLLRHRPGRLLGLYLVGSVVHGEFGPHSDVDLLAITRRSLDRAERRALIDVLLSHSGWTGHGNEHPEAAGRMPLEVTCLVASDLLQDVAVPLRDLQYGEWLRGDVLAGGLAPPEPDADVLILLAGAHGASRRLFGPELAHVVARAPAERLAAGQRAAVAPLLQDIRTDPRNVLLTLARIILMLETGAVVGKAAAAEAVTGRLTGPDRDMLALAAAEYRGQIAVDWSARAPNVGACARRLAELADTAGPPHLPRVDP